MASKVEICNEALALIGQAPITSLDEDSPQALACRTHLKKLLELTLTGHPWNCVSQRVVLNRLVDPPAFGYKYLYQLPTGYLRLNEIFPMQDYIVRGKQIHTDAEEVKIDCVIYTENTDIFQAELTSGIAHLLASRLAYQNTSSSSLARELLDQGNDLISLAKASNSFEGIRRDNSRRTWINAKFGGQ